MPPGVEKEVCRATCLPSLSACLDDMSWYSYKIIWSSSMRKIELSSLSLTANSHVIGIYLLVILIVDPVVITLPGCLHIFLQILSVPRLYQDMTRSQTSQNHTNGNSCNTKTHENWQPHR